MKTRVLITIDTEFSIAGAFRNPAVNRPLGPKNVYCPAAGASEGLEFILDILRAHQLRAVFFIEALNVYYFGEQAMGEIAHQIRAQGHELQLHLHPVWYQFRDPQWAQHLESHPPNDNFAALSLEQMSTAIADGLGVFARWGLARPQALRTGSMRVNTRVYTAMAQQGLTFSSNISMAIYPPEEPELHLNAGAHLIAGILEFPVLTYRESSMRLKSLTVTGSSWREIKYLLQQAYQQQMPYVVLLTHPFEFVKNQGLHMDHAKRNKINQARFRELCRYLSLHGDMFDTCVFADMPSDAHLHAGKGNHLLSMPGHLSALRVLENKINSISWI